MVVDDLIRPRLETLTLEEFRGSVPSREVQSEFFANPSLKNLLHAVGGGVERFVDGLVEPAWPSLPFVVDAGFEKRASFDGEERSVSEKNVLRRAGTLGRMPSVGRVGMAEAEAAKLAEKSHTLTPPGRMAREATVTRLTVPADPKAAARVLALQGHLRAAISTQLTHSRVAPTPESGDRVQLNAARAAMYLQQGEQRPSKDAPAHRPSPRLPPAGVLDMEARLARAAAKPDTLKAGEIASSYETVCQPRRFDLRWPLSHVHVSSSSPPPHPTPPTHPQARPPPEAYVAGRGEPTTRTNARPNVKPKRPGKSAYNVPVGPKSKPKT